MGDTDMVMIELRLKDGKEVVQDHPGTMVHMASEPYFTGIESLLHGVKKDGKFKGEVTFDAGAQIEEIAGRTLKAEGRVIAIQEMKVPELTDTIAKDMGYEGGADDMPSRVREHLTNHHETNAKNQARAGLLEKLIEANPFEAPKGLIAQQLQALLQELQMQAAYRGQDQGPVQPRADSRTRGRANFAAKALSLKPSPRPRDSRPMTSPMCRPGFQELAGCAG